MMQSSGHNTNPWTSYERPWCPHSAGENK